MTSKKKAIPYFDTADTKPYSVLVNSKIVLAKLFSDKDIDFQRSDSPNEIIFELRGKGAYSYQAEESRCVAYPVKINDEEIFLISLGVLFSRIAQQNSFLFSGISLKVYKPISGKIICLFRAEWDQVKEATIHAQPHWHAHFTDFERKKDEIINGKEFKSEEVQEFEEVIEQKVVGIEDLTYFSKFHFAMSADWHNAGKHLFRLRDEIALANWLEGCLKYIIEQLQYVSAHR